jgi:glycerol-3-phosphate dehydrogenase
MDVEVAVVGAGVVGAAVSLELARRGASVAVLEAEREPGLGASGTNSGILHTGFDSIPGELETELILRAGALRDAVLDVLGIPVRRCGARLAAGEKATQLIANARRNGVAVSLREDGSLAVPGEAVTDPVTYTGALVTAARRQGADLRTGFRVVSILRERPGISLEADGGERVRAAAVVNCAGLHADEVARLAGDDSFEIYPRKGEFLVFEPASGRTLDRILLPVPTKRTKGVLVFPTIDGKVIAGPTAVDQLDKHDWSVRPEARDEILPHAITLWPPLEEATQIWEYAGLRPAGRGVNYLIERSRACESLVNVAAIRSTGLTASLGIAEHVCGILEEIGVSLAPSVPIEKAEVPPAEIPWWRRAAEYRSL